MCILMKKIVYKIYSGLVVLKKWCKSFLQRLFSAAKEKPIEACMLVVTIYMSIQTYYIWQYNDESSNKQHEEEIAQYERQNELNEMQRKLDERYASQDYILKSKLNEIEVEQEAAVQKIGTILDKSAVITEQIAESNKRQADIANRMMAQSEANIEMRGVVISFPKNYLNEYNHNEYSSDSTVVMVRLIITNQSNTPIDVLDSVCKFSDGFIVERDWCGAKYIKNINGGILEVDPLAKLYDNLEIDNLEVFNEAIKKSIGDYYANLHEYPLSFHMNPFEEKIGLMFFHRDIEFQPVENSIKLGIRTNRGFFHKEFQVVPFIKK